MESKKAINRERIAVVVLAILLIIAVSYTAINEYMNVQMRKDTVIFQQGVQAGYEQAVVKLFEEVLKCEPVPLYVGTVGNQTINMTIEVIAVECLQMAQNRTITEQG